MYNEFFGGDLHLPLLGHIVRKCLIPREKPWTVEEAPSGRSMRNVVIGFAACLSKNIEC